ncbi:MAG: choloylglycine hydrolase [Clostridia bacterium]|nr:choloylglycine hydrolase [Clostridia bacterium]
MCTAATYQTKDFYFGRTLDYDFSYGEEIVITPRRYLFPMRHEMALSTNYAIIGAACVINGMPLYYDGVNEKGLCMAGLNFVGNAVYNDPNKDMYNVAQFEFIPYILGSCASVAEAEMLLSRINLTKTAFSDTLPCAQLHWIISDCKKCITVECVANGMNIYDNPVGILTNNPTFDKQLFSLNRYMGLSPKSPKNRFSDKLNLHIFSRGMGAIGLPGDLSSQSRFVRAVFVKLNSLSGEDEMSSVSQFFHILNSVDQQRGCCELDENTYEITLYTSCCNASKGIYYYTAYDNHQITAVDLHKENLDGDALVRYSMITEEQIHYQN